MPKFLEDRLKEEYGPDSKIPFKIMNSKGLMKGPNETPKGKALDRRHAADMRKKGMKKS